MASFVKISVSFDPLRNWKCSNYSIHGKKYTSASPPFCKCKNHHYLFKIPKNEPTVKTAGCPRFLAMKNDGENSSCAKTFHPPFCTPFFPNQFLNTSSLNSTVTCFLCMDAFREAPMATLSLETSFNMIFLSGLGCS